MVFKDSDMYKQENTVYVQHETVTVFLKTTSLKHDPIDTYYNIEQIVYKFYKMQLSRFVKANEILKSLHPYCYKVRIESLTGTIFTYEK